MTAGRDVDEAEPSVGPGDAFVAADRGSAIERDERSRDRRARLVDDAPEHVARVLQRDVQLVGLAGDEARRAVAGASVAGDDVHAHVGRGEIVRHELIARELELPLHPARRAGAEPGHAPALLDGDGHREPIYLR